MKRRLLLTSLFILNCLMMSLTWFENIESEEFIQGTIMLENPIALSCLFIIIIGIWIKGYYGYITTSIGWIGYICMQIYAFLTWHIKVNGGSFDLGLSFELCLNEFYFALLVSLFSYYIYKVICQKNQTQYYSMYKATLHL